MKSETVAQIWMEDGFMNVWMNKTASSKRMTASEPDALSQLLGFPAKGKTACRISRRIIRMYLT